MFEVPEDRDAMIAAGMPEDLVDSLLKSKDMAESAQEQRIAAMEDLIDSLSVERLEALMHMIRGSIADPSYGHYVNGWISTVLKHKYNVCRYCQKVHETVEDMLAAHAKENEK